MLQSTLSLVGGDEDALAGTLHAVLLLQQSAEYAEGHGGLGSRTRLGDDVDANVLALADLQQLVDGDGRDGITGEVDVGSILGEVIVEGRLQKLDDGAGTQIGAADTDGDKYITGLLDLLCGDLDAGEFLLIVVHGESRPAQEVVSCAGAGGKKLVSRVDLGLDIGQLLGGNEGGKVIGVEANRHSGVPAFHKFIQVYYTLFLRIFQ